MPLHFVLTYPCLIMSSYNIFILLFSILTFSVFSILYRLNTSKTTEIALNSIVVFPFYRLSNPLNQPVESRQSAEAFPN